MLKYRAISGVLLGAGLLAAAHWLPGPALAVLLLVVAVPALLEFHGLLRQAGVPISRPLSLGCGVALIASAAFGPILFGADWFAGPHDLVITGLVVGVLIAVLGGSHADPFREAGAVLLVLAYVPLLFSFLARLLFSWGDADGRLLVLYLILVVKCADIGAYFVGSAFGRHKLFPRVSPQKTWEGLAGGLAAAVAVSAAFSAYRGGDFVVAHIGLGHAVSLGIVLTLAGLAGDLVESMFKRAAGVKDSGHSIRGMGGVLDVIDSLLLAAPALCLYMAVFLGT